IAPAPAPTSVVPPGPPPPMPLPSHLAPAPPAPGPSPTLVPGNLQSSDVRNAIASMAPLPRPRAPEAAAKAVPMRPVSGPRRRGVVLEPLDQRTIKLIDLQTRVLERLRAQLGLDSLAADAFADEELWRRAERATTDLVDNLGSSGELPRSIDSTTLVKETLNEALGLGPLEDLLADEGIDEIRVERRDRIAVAKDGAWRGSGKAFSSDDVLYRVLARLLAPLGRRLDEVGPLIDLRLRDGARLTAALPPAALLGPSLTLRKPRRVRRTLADLVAAGTLSDAMASFLTTCIGARRNLVVCGAPGVGKTALVAALAAASPPGERVVTIEDVAELALDRDEWVALEASVAGDLGALLRIALRLAPDRLVIGDVQGREAFPLASALAGGVEGAVVAIAADGVQAALARWTSLARIAEAGPEAAVRELVATAADIVVHVARLADGGSRIVAIEEVRGVGEDGFDTQALFAFRRDGGFGATGATPAFWPELAQRGVPADPSIFQA
ncbi:MAG TPA: ATPase, T2SS/T4P/T4SS family, partial [Kofleriaceae bacterium]|nr:ATPase, T2SS/T4P/T4SS family [Kofleriaceae bacterium]